MLKERMIVGAGGLALLGLGVFLGTRLEGPSGGDMAQQDGGALAFVRGSWEVTNRELEEGMEQELYEAEIRVYNLKRRKMRSMLMERLMDEDPRKGDLSRDEFIGEFLAQSVSVSPEEVEAFIRERRIPEVGVNDILKERIRQFLAQGKRQDAAEEWLDRELEKIPVVTHFSRPERLPCEVEIGSSPFLGGETAQVSVVEFSDFQCPYCARASNMLKALGQKYGDKVKIVYKNFPLPSHPHAALAAEAGFCAQKLGGNESFWSIHDKFFERQDSLERADLIRYAKEVGLGEEDFTQCLDSREFQSRVRGDKEQGEAMGVRSTPTFCVAGQIVAGNQGIDVFSEIIDEALP